MPKRECQIDKITVKVCLINLTAYQRSVYFDHVTVKVKSMYRLTIFRFPLDYLIAARQNLNLGLEFDFPLAQSVPCELDQNLT